MFKDEQEYQSVIKELEEAIMRSYRSDAWCDWNTTTHFYERWVDCENCGGRGYVEEKGWVEIKCDKCDGEGYIGEIECYECQSSGIIRKYYKEYTKITCPKCDGAGEFYDTI